MLGTILRFPVEALLTPIFFSFLSGNEKVFPIKTVISLFGVPFNYPQGPKRLAIMTVEGDVLFSGKYKFLKSELGCCCLFTLCKDLSAQLRHWNIIFPQNFSQNIDIWEFSYNLYSIFFDFLLQKLHFKHERAKITFLIRYIGSVKWNANSKHWLEKKQ